MRHDFQKLYGVAVEPHVNHLGGPHHGRDPRHELHHIPRQFGVLQTFNMGVILQRFL